MTPQAADPSVVKSADYHRFLFGRFYDTPVSEEGLFLNVWTPAPERGAKRPVMVWLHGGGFAVGTPTRPREEASLLSARGDLVVVAPNHRLGAFGYLYREGFPTVTPNVGMLDIVAALEWVAENIEAFGGDPGNVTVVGESGGAMKTATLMTMPKARGLIHRGVCQAGVFARRSPFAALTRAAASEASERLMRTLGVGDDVEAMRAIPAAALIAAQESAAAGLMAWRPVVDGEILPHDPAEAFAEGLDLDVPMIVGWARHEADFIFHGGTRTVDELRARMGASRGERLFAAYAAARPGAPTPDVVEAVLTDFAFGMPSIQIAEARALHRHPTYVYQVVWGRSDDSSARATHGAENPFVFGRLETTGYSRGAADAAPVSKAMQGAWIAFARSGDPNGEGAPRWPAYAPPDRRVMMFDRECRIASDPKRAEREAWAEALA